MGKKIALAKKGNGMAGEKRVRYPEEVKKRAVQMYLDGKSQADVAMELGVCVQTIQAWCLRAGVSGNAKRIHMGLDSENAALKKELERIKKENEILKKAAACVSR
jgi:transposase